MYGRRDPQDHLGERLPVLRLGPIRTYAQGSGNRRGLCGTRRREVDTTRMPRAEWRKRNEAMGIGTL